MQTIYKIHPGIGIARVGPSASGYFLAGETMAASCFELDANGEEAPFTGYKDAQKLVRRQAVRFRVFEYQRNEATGVETLKREITADEAEISWSVRLAATKAAMNTKELIVFDGERALVQGPTRRNAGDPVNSLKTEVTLPASGRNFKPVPGAEVKGAIAGKPLYIGEARTDAQGRLVVLPGPGHAYSWPGPGGQQRELVDFYDNPGWYDDIADGSVDATIRIGGADVLAQRAWVMTAPPDFAPDTLALTTLYDIALAASGPPLPKKPTFSQDIEPMLDRAAGLAQTNAYSDAWLTVAQTRGADESDSGAAAAVLRQEIHDAVQAAIEAMTNYTLTARQSQVLEQYRVGDFQSTADARPALTLPEELDRAALDRTVGGGFFPGIEAGHSLRLKGIFSALARFTTGQFIDWDNKPNQLSPGLLTGRMACPWHADFIECAGAWWPSQRPDISGRAAGDVPGPDWARKLAETGEEGTHQARLNLVNHFGQLGLVLKQADGRFAEVGRHPDLDQLP